MREPDWIEHDGSAVCPVPAGHDVEIRNTVANESRYKCPEALSWDYITHYRDWTAFKVQEAVSKDAVPEPVSVTVDSVFELLDAALNGAIGTHGNKAKAFAWDVKGHFLTELGRYRARGVTLKEGDA